MTSISISTTPRALVDLVVALHEKGDFIHDPSPSVIELDETGQPFIPESELEKRSHVDVPHLVLAQLFSLLHGQSPRLKLLMARRYLKRRGLQVDDLEDVLRDHTTGEIERCFQRNRDFKTVQAGGMVWQVRRELFRDSHKVVLDDPDSFLQPGAKLLKNGRGTTVAGTPGAAVLKRFNLKKYSTIVKNQFAASKARRAFQKAYHLEIIGIRTPRVVAFSDRATLGVVHRSYLLMEQVPDVVEGAEAIRKWNGERHETRRQAIAQAGALVGRLHGSGFANRDLKSSNMLATPSGDVWLIDLDGVQHAGRVSEEVRVKNLRRIVRDLPSYGDLSLKDSMHFLRSYIRAYRAGDAGPLFRKLAEEPWA